MKDLRLADLTLELAILQNILDFHQIMCTISSPAEAEKWSPEWWGIKLEEITTLHPFNANCYQIQIQNHEDSKEVHVPVLSVVDP